jgi:hypothetical protein
MGDKTWQGSNAMLFGETSDGRVVFMVSVVDMREGGKPALQFPGGWDMTELAALTAQQAPGQRLVRRYQVQGRKAALIWARETDGNSVYLYLADGGRTIVLQAFGQGIDENHPDVKRFVESARFGEHPPTENPSGEVLPTGWSRAAVPNTTMTVVMPNPHLGPGLNRQHPDPKYRRCLHGRADGITFQAEYFPEDPIDVDRSRLPPDMQPLRVYQIEGREAWLNRPITLALGQPTTIVLGIRLETGKIVNVSAVGTGITPETPEVKRVFDSVRFGR